MTLKIKILYTLFMTALFYSLLSAIYYGEVISISGIIILMIVYLPLFLSGLWFGLIGIIFPIIVSFGLLLLGIETFILFFAIFILPVTIVSVMNYFYKENMTIGKVISVLGVYGVFLLGAIIWYNKDILSFNTVYDNVYYIIIAVNSYNKELFSNVDNIEQLVALVVFFIPTVIMVCWINLVLLNYRLANYLLSKNEIGSILLVKKDYFPIKYYNALFIIVMVLTAVVHKVLANNVNIYYILYNILFVLLSSYLYLGLDIISNQTQKFNKFLVFIIFITILMFIFLESLVILSIVGFLTAIKVFNYKK